MHAGDLPGPKRPAKRKVREPGEGSSLTGRTLRIIDANANRAREGLRVVEEIMRFLLEEPELTRRLKNARHCVSVIVEACRLGPAVLLSSRASGTDLGRTPAFDLAKGRRGFEDTVLANMRRAQESLRVLEELGRLFDRKAADRFKALRFALYALEQDAFRALERRAW